MPQQELSDWTAEQRRRVEELVDEYRVALHDSLNDLTEEEARRQLVPSKTTLLGLVKHVTFVEGVWFDQAVTGRSYEEIGIAGRRRGRTSPDCAARRWSTGEEPVPSGRFSCKSSASSHSTPATPTSCENRFSQVGRRVVHRRARGPDRERRLRSSLGPHRCAPWCVLERRNAQHRTTAGWPHERRTDRRIRAADSTPPALRSDST